MSRLPTRSGLCPARLIKRFQHDRAGAVAVVLAAAAVPILCIAGAALDYSRASDARVALQRITDAAALNAAIAARDKTGSPETVAESTAQSQAAELPQGATLGSVAYSAGGGEHTVAADATLKTTLLSVLGWTSLSISARATATAATASAEPTEIVMVLDVTSSMAMGPNWVTARSWLKEMLERLKTAPSGEFHATLVPMSDRVNAASAAASASAWIKGPVPTVWDGCCEPRENAETGYPHALDDRKPVGGDRLVPSVPGNYIPNHVGPVYPWSGVPACPSAPITGPTSNVADLSSALAALTPYGTGRFDEGLVWAWRLLSPKWRGEWKAGSTYPAKKGERRKIVVFMTDGLSRAYEFEVGGLAGGFFGVNLGSPMGFDHFLNVCKKMHDEDIEIHVVQLPGNTYFTDYARKCASKPEYYTMLDQFSDFKLALDRVGASSAGPVRLTR